MIVELKKLKDRAREENLHPADVLQAQLKLCIAQYVRETGAQTIPELLADLERKAA